MDNNKKSVYLTEEEIDFIATLNESTLDDYIINLDEDKKQLVMKQYSKEMEIKLWKGIAQERY